ncbi:MAG: cation:dicarboxylase symporter family transporter, partial [Acinetobacter sp.]|nr:cation:dicarboxylase symporter family transporter [Acinetobacter sp.]
MFNALSRLGLVPQILIAMLLGILFGIITPAAASQVSILGDLFVKALLSVAPILVFVLVMSSIANFKVETSSKQNQIKPLLLMYVIGMLLAASLAIIASLAFPSTLLLDLPPESREAPDSVATVLKNLVLSFFMNPVTAIGEAKFISILIWA